MGWRASSAGKGLLVAGAAILTGLSLFHFAASAHRARAFGVVDFPIFLAQAAEFLETGVLYPDPEDSARYAPAAPVYKFPPLYAMSLLPIARGVIQPRVFLYHWGLQIALYLLAVALALAGLRAGRRLAPFGLLGLVVALNFEPFFETLWRLQLETPILLLLTLAFLLFRRGRDRAAGSLIGICVMLKLYPVFLLPYFAIKKRWRLVGWCLLTMALVQVATLIVIGLPENVVYFTRILPSMAGENPVVNPENVSIGSYAQTLLGAGPGASKRIGQGIVLVLLAISAWVVHRRDDGRDEIGASTLEYSLFIALMLLALPNAWVNYQLLLLFPLLALGRYALVPGPRRVEVTVLALLAWIPMLFYAPCAGPELSWPCAQTPYLLGLFQLPRPLHDGLVHLRGLAPLLIWCATILALTGTGTTARAAAGAVNR